MNNKDFYAVWKNYLNESKHLLQEMDDDYVDLINGATQIAKTSPEKLQFPQIFEDKLRFVVPFKKQIEFKVLSKLLMFLQDSLAMITTEKNRYVVTYAAEEVTQRLRNPGQNGFREEKRIVTKINIAEYNFDIEENKEKPVIEKFKDEQGNASTKVKQYTVISALNNVIRVGKNLINNYKNNKPNLDKYGKDIKYKQSELDNTLKFIEYAQLYIDWWNKNQAKITQDPDLIVNAVNTIYDKYNDSTYFVKEYFTNPQTESNEEQENTNLSIVFSRMPIDVLRMSDFPDQGITSCHSTPDIYESPNYFECTLTEAQNLGAIAYLVKTKDLEKVNLQDDEIFGDKDRGIKGIYPLERVRIRNIINTKTKESIAVVETRIYPGARTVGFFQQVLELVSNKQIDSLIKEDENGNKTINIPERSELELAGGSYIDTPDGIPETLKQLLQKISKFTGVVLTGEQKDILKTFHISHSQESEKKEREMRKNIKYPEQEEEIRRREQNSIFQQALENFKTRTSVFDIDANIEFDDDGFAEVSFGVSFNTKIDYKDINQQIKDSNDNNFEQVCEDVDKLFFDYLGNWDKIQWLEFDIAGDQTYNIDADSCFTAMSGKQITFKLVYDFSLINVTIFSRILINLLYLENAYKNEGGLQKKLHDDFKEIGILGEKVFSEQEMFDAFLKYIKVKSNHLVYSQDTVDGEHNHIFNLYANKDAPKDKEEKFFLVLKVTKEQLMQLVSTQHRRNLAFDQNIDMNIRLSDEINGEVSKYVRRTIQKQIDDMHYKGSKSLFPFIPAQPELQLPTEEREIPMYFKVVLEAFPFFTDRSHTIDRKNNTIEHYVIYAKDISFYFKNFDERHYSLKEKMDYLEAVDKNPSYIINIISKELIKQLNISKITENKKRLVINERFKRLLRKTKLG